MTAIHARLALLPESWASDVRIDVIDGRITTLATGIAPQPGDERHDLVMPGMPNLHSHAFQRGMAGLAEIRGLEADTFWTWRDVMYRFALTMNPDQMQAIAAQLYVEMLEAGYTRAGEFHYLHHDRDGSPYADPAEMAWRIAAASQATGIRLTLLPVLYSHATFGGVAPLPEQRRFTCDLDQFARLLDASRQAISPLEGAVLGVAPHSLRAVTGEELAAVIGMAPEGPVHIHVAEQEREVSDSLAWSGQRPVAWLLDHAAVDARWCLIHATHMTAAETTDLASTGAVAGLCPVTEANLGDGIFPAPGFLAAGGRFGIGTDSNIRIGVTGELRQLEYAQRLRQQERNVLARTGSGTGRSLFDSAYCGGQQALGVSATGLVPGSPADFVSLARTLWEGDDGDGILNAWIFASGVEVDGVWTGGRKVVANGRHLRRDAIAAAFRRTMRELVHA